MEIALRMAFCALIGGPYAAVVAVGQETHWLTENCDAVARKHEDIPADQRERNPDRASRLPGGKPRPEPARARGLGHRAARHARSHGERAAQLPDNRSAARVEEIRATADAMLRAQQELLAAIEDALGSDTLQAVARLLARKPPSTAVTGRRHGAGPTHYRSCKPRWPIIRS